jgi:peptide deformylase
MAILKIARMGHPVLRRHADPVTLPFPGVLRQLALDMVESMADAPGVGLAAPQVHVSWRMIVFKVPAERAGSRPGDEALDAQVLINPEVTPLTDEMELGWEGCLSVPGLRGAVPRYTRIGYRGLALDGSLIEREATGFHARVVQHEVDHLDGILYLDRMTDLRHLTYVEEMKYFGGDRAARPPV